MNQQPHRRHRVPGRPLVAVASLVLLAVSLAGCGGEEEAEPRPSVKEISSGISSQLAETNTSTEFLDCVAGALRDSDLSDEALRAIADHDEDYQASTSDESTLEELSTAAKDCAESGG